CHLHASKLPFLRPGQEPVRFQAGRLPGGRRDLELGGAHADLARKRASDVSADLYRRLLHRGLRRALLARTRRKARPDALLSWPKAGYTTRFFHTILRERSDDVISHTGLWAAAFSMRFRAAAGTRTNEHWSTPE